MFQHLFFRKLFFGVIILFLFFNSILYAQYHIIVRGKVSDVASGKPITFASVMVKNQKKGTVTDTLGNFILRFSQLSKKDTLEVSYLGYEDVKKAISDKMDFMNIKLVSKTTMLDDVVVTPFKPTYYIDEAIKRVHDNYNYNPYYIISYFENNFYENTRLLAGTKTVFKTYYEENKTNTNQEPKQDHQLLLYKQEKDTHTLKFMRKQLSKSIENKQTNEGDTNSSNFKIRLTPMYIPIQHISLPFLNKEYYKKFIYKIRETCNKRDLIIIDFKTKRRFSYNYVKFKGSGTIYIDCKNYAIIKLDMNMNMELSFALKSLLFIGFHKMKVKKVTLLGSIEYKSIDDVWYPSTLSLSGSGDALKFRWFASNSKANFGFSSSTLVSKVITDSVVPIPDKKQFSFRKVNIQNDMNISWGDIITVKHKLYEALKDD